MFTTTSIPSHESLQLPLLDVLDELGPVTPAEAASAVVDKLGLDPDILKIRRPMPGWSRAGLPVFQHRLRWVRTELVEKGFLSSPERGIWAIADRGRNFLTTAKPGVIVSVFETDLGMCLFADARHGVAAVNDGTFALCFTSPPFPVVSGRSYGTFSETECVDLISDFCAGLKPKLADDASLYLNLGNTTLPGGAASLYQQRLLLNLCDHLGYTFIQPHYWHSPSKPPTGHYVTRTRTRLKDGVEVIYQLGKSANVRADNRAVLEPYKATMQRTLRNGGDSRASRPSRQGHCGHSFDRDNGGAIPANLQVISNASSNSAYYRAVRAAGLPAHPARFPDELPERAILMHTAKGDVVADFFAGSLNVPLCCERHDRQWVAGDRVLELLRGGELMFKERPGYQSHAITA